MLPSPYATEPSRPVPMDVAEAPVRPPPYFIVSPRSSSWLLASNRYLCHHTSGGNMYRFALNMTNTCSHSRSVVFSAKKGRSVDASKGLHKVIWTIQADLDAGELLYVTGDPTVLGSWKPDMAILMSPTDNENEWRAEVEIDSGVNFRYNYFVRAGSWSSLEVLWRPGPNFSISIPSSASRNKEIIVMDSWTRFSSKRCDGHMWGSWMEETFLPVPALFSSSAVDESKTEDGSKDSRQLLDRRNDETFSSSALFLERHQPVEEPWLLQPYITLDVMRDIQTDVYESVGYMEDSKKHLDINDQSHSITETLLPEEGIFSEPESFSTTILINSSICTMQRIAVLEDKNLVELLLEPVKTNVQCDSVYLGAVNKFVPHMGGAFVNIGSSRHSFMDIKPNREPFIFPPFSEMLKKRESNGSLFHSLEEGPDFHEIEHTHNDSEVGRVSEIGSPIDSGEFTHDDDEEHDVDEDLDVSEILDGNLNGSIVDYGEMEGDIEEYAERELHSLEGQNLNGLFSSEMERFGDHQTSMLSGINDLKVMETGENRWLQVRKGTKIIVQVVKEGLGTKAPTLTAYPKLKSRFWVLITRCDRIGVSKKICGVERTRLKVIAKTLQPKGFGLTVRTVAAGRSLEELQRDLEGLLLAWKTIIEDAKSAALAADEGVEGAIPVLLHRAMGQTLSVVQDYFNDKVKKMVVDSPRTYHEVTNYLQEIAPDLCDRVKLYDKRVPLFDLYNIEEEINSILSKRVPLRNGGSLVIEQTEALVSIDVNGGHGMFGQGNSQEKAILEVNLAAARQIARELRLRDIGGIIVVDFIDMADESNKRLVYEEVKKAVERDRSLIKVSELSKHGLMEITRKRVRPSVTFMISEPCSCCHATGRVEALETSFAKVEQEICRLLAKMDRKTDPERPNSWPRFILKVDNHMSNYLTTGKRTRLAILSSSLKVWILLKVARHFTRGTFEVKPFSDEKSGQNQHQVAISLLRKADGRSDGSGKKVTLIPIKKGKASGRRSR